MAFALEKARQAAEIGEVPVGALVLSETGGILALAANRMVCDSNPCAHAELLAIQKASRKRGRLRLANCFLVCTLEPCLMCAAAAAHARIAGIVYGASDPMAGAIHSRADFALLPFSNGNMWHMGGILGTECAGLLNNFFAKLRHADSNLC